MAIRYRGDPDEYPPEVALRIRRDETEDYDRAAWALDHSHVDAVSIQHEYGIWGGPNGSLVLDFVMALHKPTVTTLHTVPQQPSPDQRRILTSLVELSTATVVMSRSAARLLRELYGVDEAKVDVIAHGVPDLPLRDPESVKPGLGLESRPVILSFGLIGPGKGYESVIEAMPEVARSAPRALYVILGATHPELLRLEGEAYRTRLMRLAEVLGVHGSVLFVNRYVGLEELGQWLEAADIFVTPYPNPDQVVSGTLSYAMGAGKAIVSTPYAYAQEMLDDGTGIVVPAASPKSLAEALTGLLGDERARRRLGRIAYARSRSMIWPQVGAQYRAVLERAAYTTHSKRHDGLAGLSTSSDTVRRERSPIRAALEPAANRLSTGGLPPPPKASHALPPRPGRADRDG